MSGLPERRAEAARWLEYAQEDLATARMVLGNDGPLRQVCNLSQQSAEKALKAGLVFDDQDPPRSHNLNQIVELLADEWSVKRAEVHLGSLSGWAIASRYPGDWEEPTLAEAREAIETASSVLRAMGEDFQGR